MSRLRDHRVYNNIRLYLSYFYDQNDICYEGMTQTNIKVLIDQEGLPTDCTKLRRIYYKYHCNIGVSHEEVKKDLVLYRRYIDNKYRGHLQRIRENWQNYLIVKP